jgi:hypothetical protein
MNELTNPPAVVRAAEDFETCLQNAAALGRRVVADSIACGNWLIKAKDACPHGQWLPSLKKYGFTPRTTQRLMAAARAKCDSVSHLGLDAPPTWQEVWLEAGVRPWVTSGEDLRESLREFLAETTGQVPDLPVPEGKDEVAFWHMRLLRALAEQGASHLLRTGRHLPPPPAPREPRDSRAQ